MMSTGFDGRWTIGIVILIHLINYNEAGGATAVLSTVIACCCALFSAYFRSSLSHIQIAYLRATQKQDFFCLFLALWMDILSLLTACGALARTLSTCLDEMTGGMARIYLLGRNSPENEPWPDILGVSVVFLLTVMFMLGLENTRVFNYLMVAGVVGITIILTALSWIRGKFDAWQTNHLLPKGLHGLLTSAGLCTFTFAREFPIQYGAYKKFISVIIFVVMFLSALWTAGCLSTITQFDPKQEFVAVPIFYILETQDFHKVEPAIACLLVLACSGAFLELFSEMYTLFVRLTTSEWRILARQIDYENSESGSPVLAIFTGGSLCAMLAFACPLQNLIYILAASHLCAGICRAFFLLYSPYRPKYMLNNSHESSSAYSRLDTAPKAAASTSRKSIWSFNKPTSISLPTPKSRLKKSKHDEELEREWLLLGEPQSPRVVAPEPDAESSIICDPPSDVDRLNATETDSSTDIDAIVDEYRQKVKVSTAGPMEQIIRIPSIESWRLVLFFIFLLCLGVISAVYGSSVYSEFFFYTGTIVVFIVSFILIFLPKYSNSPSTPSSMACGVAILLHALLLGATLSNSWPAIIFWILAGLTLYIRCDTWCCLCLERPRSHQQLLIPSVASNMTSIRIPCPPRGSMIPSRISGHR